MNDRALRGSRWRKCGLLTVAVLFALALSEGIVRLLDVGPEINPVHGDIFRLSDNPRLRYELVPGAERGDYQINDLGMRDRDYSVDKPPRTFRIACTGDSITLGYKVEQSESYSSRLELLLNKHFPEAGLDFEVLNFGVTGYNFAQIRENIRSRILEFDPDLIVYGYCLNDPQDYSWEMAALSAKLTASQRSYLDALSGSAVGLAQRSRLFLLARYVLGSRTGGGREKQRPVRDPQRVAFDRGDYANYYAELHRSRDSWAAMVAGIAELRDLLREHHVPMHLFVFPILKQLDDYTLRAVHDRIIDEFSAPPIRALDLLPYFRTVLERDGLDVGRNSSIHPTAEGHLLTALVMLHDVLSQGAIPGLGVEDFQRIQAEPGEEGRFAELVWSVATRGRD